MGRFYRYYDHRRLSAPRVKLTELESQVVCKIVTRTPRKQHWGEHYREISTHEIYELFPEMKHDVLMRVVGQLCRKNWVFAAKVGRYHNFAWDEATEAALPPRSHSIMLLGRP